jgi:hypothetical protein
VQGGAADPNVSTDRLKEFIRNNFEQGQYRKDEVRQAASDPAWQEGLRHNLHRRQDAYSAGVKGLMDRPQPFFETNLGKATAVGGAALAGYGAYRGGKALYNHFKQEPEDMSQKTASERAIEDVCAHFKIAFMPALMGRIATGGAQIGRAAQGAFNFGRTGAAMGGNTASAIGQGALAAGKQFMGTRGGQNAAILGGTALAGGMLGRATAPSPMPQPARPPMPPQPGQLVR